MRNISSEHSKPTRGWTIPFYLVLVSILFLYLIPTSEAEEIQVDTDIYLFGSGLDGNLGTGNENNQLDPLRLQSSVFDAAGISGADIKEISAGQIGTWADGTTKGVGAHTLIVTNDGDVYSFGNNKYGQLGQGHTNNVDIPTKIEGLPVDDPAISVVAKGFTSFVLTESGSVYSFGGDSFGSLGLGDLKQENEDYYYDEEKGNEEEYKYEVIDDRYIVINEPKKIELDLEKPEYDIQLPAFKEISVGGGHGLFLSDTGDVYSFGSGSFGKLGHGDDGTDGRKYVPTKIDSLSNIESVSAGHTYSLVLTGDGNVYSFGTHLFIGQGEYDDPNAIESEPKRIIGLPAIEKISAGWAHSLLLDENNNVYSFGGDNSYTVYGENSRLGLDEDINRQLEPNFINELNGVTVTDIAAGDRHSLVATDTGEIYSFGQGHSGQLGHGDEEDQWAPKKIESLNQVTQIAAGTNYSFVIGLPVVELEDLRFNGQTVAGFESDNFNYNVTLPFGTEIIPVVDGTAKKVDSTIDITQATEVDGAATIVAMAEDGVTSNTYTIDFSVSTIEPSDAYLFGEGYDDTYLSPIKVDNLSEVIAVSAGGGHVLALTENGTVYSFAADDDNLGHRESGDEPVEVNGLPDIGVDKAVAVSAGLQHNLVLTETGDVYSFGDGGDGRLGHGSESDEDEATKIEGITDVIAVSAGFKHSLFLTEAGDVYSFGLNGEKGTTFDPEDEIDGRLGNGENITQLSPEKIVGVSGIQAISAGREHSLLLDGSGNVYSFGDGSYGRLGHGDTDNQLSPKQITSIENVEAISAGDDHNLVLTTSGEVYSFGRDSVDQLGHKDGGGNQLTPKKIEALSNVASISAGENHNLVVTDTGDVYSFGDGGDGQLGHGDTEPRFLPTKIIGISEGIIAEAGGTVSIVTSSQTPDMTLLADLSVDGETIYGFEKNKKNYQITLPYGTTAVPTIGAVADYSSNDVTITQPSSFTENATIVVSDGTDTSTYTIEIIVAQRQFDKVGEAFSFGEGANGQLGLGDTKDQLYPRYLSTIGNIVDVSVGDGYTLLFNDLGEAYSFGNSNSGRLGHNPAISYSVPQKIEFISDVVAVSAGSAHNLILTGDGELYSFGDGSDSRLGHGNTYNELEPKKVEGLLSNISTISAGREHNLILTDDRKVYGFGEDNNGRLGGDDETDTDIPVLIDSLTELGVKDISAGGSHNLVLTVTDAVYSFGESDDGRLGLGEDISSDQAAPMNIEGFDNVIDISAGGDHSLILNDDGEVYSFGRGYEGQLGHGDNENQWEPKKIESLADETVIAVKAGFRHSLVLTENGEVYAFGEGGEGRLGLGNNESYSTPQRISCLSGIDTIAAGFAHSIALGSPGISPSLCGMLVDGTPFEGFDPETVSYDVELETGTNEVPTVVGIPVDSRADVQVNEAANLPGTTTITVTSTDGTDKTYSIDFLVDLTYTIDVSGQPTFNDVREEYSPIPIEFVSIERTGTGDITNLSATVSGEDADAFEVGDLGGVDPRIDEELQPQLPDEELGVSTLNDDFSSTSFALGPKDDLKAGEYSATVTITADEGVQESFDINFNVEAIPSEPDSQATNLTFSSTSSNDIVLSFDASEAAEGYVVVRKDDEDTTFTPEFGTTYSAGSQEGDVKIIGSGSETSYEDSDATRDTDYYYAIYAYNGSGDERVYRSADPLQGQSKLHGGEKASNVTVHGSNHSTSSGFPDAGVTITFPEGMQQDTTFTIEKVTSEPSNFMAQPNVRRVSPLHFNIKAEPNNPGNYTLVLDFSDLGLTSSQWENFIVFKRDEVTSQWQDVVTDLGAEIVDRQTDGVWGKFTISGLDSFSQFAGGEVYEAATHKATISSSDGEGSLRQAIIDAEAGDVIIFDELPSNQVDITETLLIDKDLTIRGSKGTAIDGGGQTRIFDISPDVSVKLENLKIQNGYDDENVVGGILNEGYLTVVNSIIANNTADGVAGGLGGVGGILQDSPNTKLVLINTTVTGNTGASEGGGTGGIGVYEMNTGEQGPVEIYNSIIYGNEGEHPDAIFEKELNVSSHSLYGFAEGAFSVIEASGNLFDTDPQFVGEGAHPYLITKESPVIDKGDNQYINLFEGIRGSGFRRVIDGQEDGTAAVDIGAYEYQLAPTYTMTYDGNGNTGGNIPTDNDWYAKGDLITIFGNTGNLSKVGQAFGGWNTEEDGNGTTYSEGDTFTMGNEGVTLYAEWMEITGINMTVDPSEVHVNENFEETFALTIEKDTVTEAVYASDISLGGKFENLTISEVTSKDTIEVTSKDSIVMATLKGSLTEEGIGSITIDADKLQFSEENLTVEVTVVQDEATPAYTVTYHGNDNTSGSVPVDENSYSEGDRVAVLRNTGNLEKSGFNFINWNTKADGTGTPYVGSSSFLIDSENVDLYANWTSTEVEDNSFTVTFDSGAGSSVNSITAENDTIMTAPTAPTRAGYNFVGWYKEDALENQWNFATDKVTEDITLFAKWNVIPTSGGGSSEPSDPEPSTEEITIPVETGDADSGSIVSETPNSRTTDSNGRKIDSVTLSSDRMKDSVQTIRDAGQNTARIRIPDDQDDVSEVNINIPKESTKELRDNAINLEIFTDNVRITVPESSMADFDEDLFFRLTPIKDEPQRQDVENRARVEEQVREISNGRSVNVVARPMTIETNMQSRAVNLVLPLRDVELPTDADEQADYLKDLVIFIEHSDGDRELVRANVVNYKVDQLGLEFNVTKFSTFTILNMEGWGEHMSSTFHEAYIKGFEDGTFKPNNSVTRAEIAAMIARNLGYDESQSVTSTSFPDVKVSHWAVGAIAFVKEQELMNGNHVGKFHADAPITRAEIAAVAARYQELTLPTEAESATAFPDIAGHWAVREIAAIKSANIVNGDDNGRYRPNEDLTRAEAVKVINRMFDRGPLYGVETPSFPDVPDTHWAINEVEEAAQNHSFTVRPEGGENIVE